jgi:threonine dehydrogenase-like Zn-dependent dehydrogenase
MATILLKEITVRGSYIDADEFDRAIDLLATQQVKVADLTTVVSPLGDAPIWCCRPDPGRTR